MAAIDINYVIENIEDLKIQDEQKDLIKEALKDLETRHCEVFDMIDTKRQYLVDAIEYWDYNEIERIEEEISLLKKKLKKIYDMG